MKKLMLGAIVAALFAAAAAAQDDEGRPKIFFEKKIFSDTTAGRKNFYEVHTVREGESLWKIIAGGAAQPPGEIAALIKEFLRANPQVKRADRLRPGQQVYIPSAALSERNAAVTAGRAEAYKVARGDRLIKVLAKRGVAGADMSRYLGAVKELNPSIRNVDRIMAGGTIRIPTSRYFEPAEELAAKAEDLARADRPEAAAPQAPGAMALTKEAPPAGPAEGLPVARPEAQLAPPAAPQPETPAVATGRPPEKKEEPRATRPKPPYRGLLMDVVAGLGEKWQDKGTLYIPVPSGGGEVVLKLEEFPVIRFATGVHALIDFNGALTPSIRALITETWKNYRVVVLDGASDAAEMIDRVLKASGYHSVKDGLARPLVIGESVEVSIPARWVVLPTEKSLLSGQVVLIKQVAEKPGPELAAVLRYAERVGIRVIPYAVDAAALEGFVVGVDPGKVEEDPPARMVPAGGVPAVDFALDFLGIPAVRNERIRIGKAGKGTYELTVQPEILFDAGGKRFIVDTGRMSPALLSLVRESGYSVLRAGKDETGVAVFRKVLAAAGIPSEERRNRTLSGGGADGYEVRGTGLYLTSKELQEKRSARVVLLVRGKVHAATRAMLRDVGVDIAGW